MKFYTLTLLIKKVKNNENWLLKFVRKISKLF